MKYNNKALSPVRLAFRCLLLWAFGLGMAGQPLSYAAEVVGTSPEQASLPFPPLPKADLQIFGDVFISTRSLEVTKPSTPFGDALALLETSRFNVVNLEGVVARGGMDIPDKQFHLRMPALVSRLLRQAHIHAVTLANNHSMDFGWIGLFEMLNRLRDAGIRAAGAGANYGAASDPVYFDLPTTSVCILSFTRSWPDAIWATVRRPGTANPSPQHLKSAVGNCIKNAAQPVVIFHWGRELERNPQPYQRELGRIAIDAGAIAVVGHHPHILQEVEVYRNRPIFYSLGNFAFASIAARQKPEGAALRIDLSQPNPVTFELVPLNVNNSVVKYKPRPLYAGEEDSVEPILKPFIGTKKCQRIESPTRWRCIF